MEESQAEDSQFQMRFTRPIHHAPVRVSAEQFDAALTSLVLQGPLRVASPSPAPSRQVRTVSLSSEVWRAELVHSYEQHCQQSGTPGDCLHLFRNGPHLEDSDKRDIALALSVSAALESRDEALRSLFSTSQLWATVSLTLSGYLALLVAPEPVSKGVAAALAVLLWAYLGVEFFTLIRAYVDLRREAAEATTFAQLRTAGRRFGQVLGPNSVHILLMLGTAAVGDAAALVSRAPSLPGYALAAARAESEGVLLGQAALEADQVQVAVAAGTFSVVLPANALSMSVRDSLSRASQTGKPEVHHIATVENTRSTARGGPWTPRFKEIFDEAGMSMEDPANKVSLSGHRGPHPEAYHKEIFRRLNRATVDCNNPLQCRDALTAELRKLARELLDSTSETHKLLTQ